MIGRRKEILWAGEELKVSVDAGLKQLKVISRGEDGAFQSLEVIGIKELVKALVRFLSNLRASSIKFSQKTI